MGGAARERRDVLIGWRSVGIQDRGQVPQLAKTDGFEKYQVGFSADAFGNACVSRGDDNTGLCQPRVGADRLYNFARSAHNGRRQYRQKRKRR